MVELRKKAYVIAYPAGHSLSPIMQNAAFRHLKLNAYYESLEVPPDKLKSTVEDLRLDNVYGANVTIPHKLAVRPLLDKLTEEAQNIGAVNTIINKNGSLTGHNTDAVGFLRALKEDANFDPKGHKVVMLGAGGAARAVLYALLIAKAREVGIYNRTSSKADKLASDLDHLGKVQVVNKNQLMEFVQQATLLVNTTSLGMEKFGVPCQGSPLPKNILPNKGLICDIIYKPKETLLLKNAKEAGLKIQNGLPMLVYQGAEAFSKWTNQEAPIKVMFTALKQYLD